MDVSIRVLRCHHNQDFVQEYGNPKVAACPSLKEGQGFVVKNGQRPEGFCDWAWQDLRAPILTLAMGGSFKPWLQDDATYIGCCTDGLRPVVFELRRVER
jgi:uncharacterized repeat protein (TIGR04076 family)